MMVFTAGLAVISGDSSTIRHIFLSKILWLMHDMVIIDFKKIFFLIVDGIRAYFLLQGNTFSSIAQQKSLF
jgi:hypothetical protein